MLVLSNSSPQFSLFVLLIILFITFSSFPSSVLSSSHFNPLLLPSDDDDRLCPRPTPTETDPCPVKCFRTDPVCGVDGVTYWCGCSDAHCAGTRVAKLGFCGIGNGVSAPLSGQALLLLHIVWLILLAIFLLFGLL